MIKSRLSVQARQLMRLSTSFADVPQILSLCVLCVISRGSSLYFLRYIVTLTRYSQCGWRWLEKPERLYWRALDVGFLLVIGPRVFVIQPIDFRTLLLYYTWWPSQLLRPWRSEKYILHKSTGTLLWACLENRTSWFYLMPDYTFHVQMDLHPM